MARRTIRTRLLVIIVVLAALAGIAHFSVRMISTGPLRTLVEKDLSEALGLAVSIDQFEAALLPTPHLRAEGLRVANRPDRHSPHLLSIERIELEFEFWPLLERMLVVNAFEIGGADLYIETDAQGRQIGRAHV